MGLYTIPVTKQEVVTKYSWPKIMEGAAGVTILDQLQRESLTPTGTPTLYTVASTGGGSGVMNTNGGSLTLTSSGAIGNDVDVRYGVVFNRGTSWRSLDSKSTLEFDIIFNMTTVTSIEGFIGLIIATTNAITALPTTAVHMGVYWDISAGANFTLSSSNGTSQSTTGTGIAVAATTSTYRLNIVWNGLNSSTLNLYSGTNAVNDALATSGTSHTVSDLNGVNNMKMHFFIQNEATASRTLDILEWQAKSY